MAIHTVIYTVGLLTHLQSVLESVASRNFPNLLEHANLG